MKSAGNAIALKQHWPAIGSHHQAQPKVRTMTASQITGRNSTTSPPSWCDARIPLTRFRAAGPPSPHRMGRGAGWGVFGNLADRTR